VLQLKHLADLIERHPAAPPASPPRRSLYVMTNTLGLPPKSMNALMQYLKRKRFVEKNGRELHAPYSLTAEGLAALAEMTRRQAA